MKILIFLFLFNVFLADGEDLMTQKATLSEQTSEK